MELRQILYLSLALRPMTTRELLELATQSQAKNERSRITGVLLYGHGRFMQLIEGESGVIGELMDRIVLDERHKDIAVLKDAAVEQRMFPEWTLSLITLDQIQQRPLQDPEVGRLFGVINRVADATGDADVDARALIQDFRVAMQTPII